MQAVRKRFCFDILFCSCHFRVPLGLCRFVEDNGSYLYGVDDFEMQGVLCCMKFRVNSEQRVEDWRLFGHESGSESGEKKAWL